MKPVGVCARINCMDGFLKKIPHNFPVTERPYEEMAGKIGVAEGELIERLQGFMRDGMVRRVAAVLYHRKALYTHNAMVVWKVDEDDMERVGEIMASYPEVSHCYERDGGGFWDYTLYTMIHGKDMESCMDAVRRMSERAGVRDFRVFLSRREFKKTSFSVHDDEDRMSGDGGPDETI